MSSAPATPLIRTESLTRRYRMGRQTVEALRGVDLEIGRGEYAAITGPSGSGKSTLVNILAFLLAGIMNIMLVTVTERTREIGIRKALGATRTDILTQFLAESVVLCVLGGLLGMLLGTAVARALARYADWQTYVTADALLLAFAFSAVVGLVFGLWPARRAAALDPIAALRYE